VAGEREAGGVGREGVAGGSLEMLGVGSMVVMREPLDPTVEGLGRLGGGSNDWGYAGPAFAIVLMKTTLVSLYCFPTQLLRAWSSVRGLQPCEPKAPPIDVRKLEVCQAGPY